MDKVHGIDASWLHHHSGSLSSSAHTIILKSDTNKHVDSPKLKNPAPRPKTPQSPPQPKEPLKQRHSDVSPNINSSSEPPAASPNPSGSIKSTPKRPGILSKTSVDKLPSPHSNSSDNVKSSSKRPAWISSLNSRFSSSRAQVQPLHGHASPPSQTDSTKPTQSSTPLKPSAGGKPSAPAGDGSEEGEDTEPYVPQQPKTSFFSALRRLSSSGPAPDAHKIPGNGGVCPRQVLNVDKDRERCPIKELDQSKLRRVAFSVDVEVAGVSRYIEEPEPPDQKKKFKDKKLMGRSEGEALKNPKAVAEHKDKASGTEAEGHPRKRSVDEILEAEMTTAVQQQDIETAYKRRQEKQHQRQQESLEENNISSTSPASAKSHYQAPPLPTSSSGSPTLPRTHDKPTTDPLRMYRRCCQLREAPVLKRISEQLATMQKNNPEEAHVVNCLDLNGSRLQLPDLVCLGDWLAIVPVKRLLMDNANLSDEGLRVVLAGLLAAKPPELMKRKRGKSSPTRPRKNTSKRCSGVIEKLSLRNNLKITAEGWKHLCIFLNLSHSIKAVDMSLTPFPDTAVPPRDTKDSSASNTTGTDPPSNMANVLSNALSDRNWETQFEELILSDCKLKTYHVQKIVDGVISSGIHRLGLAKNALSEEALFHVARYLCSGKCKGLDLGGNDLRDTISIVTEALRKDNQLFALSLASCGLDTDSLSALLPALSSLPDFRFLDISHNRDLFDTHPSALGVMRRYFPKFKSLRRLHLADISLSPGEAIGIAEILPEIRNLNHVSLLENPELAKLASTEDPAQQEDACAFYASLMVASRLSKCLFAVEVENPVAQSSNQVVNALAKQIDAYSLRNMERYMSNQAMNLHDPASAIPDEDKDVAVPDILLHIVGESGEAADNGPIDENELAPDQDYLVSGTGIVKALSYCLGQGQSDLRRMSGQLSGAATPTQRDPGAQARRGKAKDMSKEMLNSARKVRARLQAAIDRESSTDDEMALRKLPSISPSLHSKLICLL